MDAFIITPSKETVVESIRQQLLGYGVQEKCIYEYRDYLPCVLIEEEYFDKDIIQIEQEEVFIDAGVYDLETSELFCEVCKSSGVKNYRVHAFEPDYISYCRCKERIDNILDSRIKLYNTGLWSQNTKVFFDAQGSGSSRISDCQSANSIDVVTLDSCIQGKVTFIKMDIEGSELEALKGAERIIRTQKPKLAICIYHKPEDMFDIPKYIKELVPQYKLYVRHYSNAKTETVLYAV